ncbi:MAG: S8 family serine peptidase, partial [Thermomicrobiales bacterium]
PEDDAMLNRGATSTMLLAALMLLGIVMPSAARGAQPATDLYIVVFRPNAGNPSAIAADLGRTHGLEVRHVYRTAFSGFAARVPAAAVAGLSRNPNVAFIEPDRPVELAQTLPTGVDRIDADLDATAAIDGNGATGGVGVGIAVIDTGIDVDHPDLNVAGGVDCVPGDGLSTYDDDHGHGTHVAGTAGARDNAVGVVGVAPDAPLWAVKVVPGSGPGLWSDVICGIDWVTANAGTVQVANMSLTGVAVASDQLPCGDPGTSAVHLAICASVAAGVTYAVAAGNQSSDAGAYIPGTYDEVLTVSALADFDGQRGGLSSSAYTCPSQTVSRDDSFLCLSNFGPDVDLAAPGTTILSTARGGGTAIRTGTSMASPHVAGAAALYLQTHSGAGPAAVRGGLVANSDETTNALTNPTDPDGIPEPIVSANFSGGAGPTPTPTATPTATASPTPTPTPAATPMPTTPPSATPSPSPTATPPPTATSTPLPTNTPAPTETPVPTSTPAPLPPVISQIDAKPSKNSATIRWTTDVPATSTVYYGVNGATDLAVSDPTLTTSHEVTLTGLERRTVYTFVVESSAGGLTSTSGAQTFRTR